MPNIGPLELIIILAILLLLFGATRLPKLARSIGKSAGELQKGFREGVDNKENKTDSEEK